MNIPESNYRASQKYQREKCRKITVQMNKRIDADVLGWLDSLPNKAGYIKDLIREDMARNGFRLPERAEHKTYWGFSSFSANDEYADEFEDKAFDAKSKEDARKMCAEWLKSKGCESVELSTTSEEVCGSLNGAEIVYYGFDAEDE